MKCPECSSVLVTLEFDRIEIDYCPGCEGIWLDSGELGTLLEREEGDGLLVTATSHARRKEKKRRCPICTKGMEKVHMADSGVLLDSCPGHGLWFDAGELGKVLETACAPGDGQDRADSLVRLLDEMFFARKRRTKLKEGSSCRQGR